MIPHSRPYLDKEDFTSILKAAQMGSVFHGKIVAKFEKAMAGYIGVKDAAAVNSGTSALHLSLLALGIKKGDEVILPSYVCTALLNAVFYVGAVPRIGDINKEDFNISVSDIKKKINKKTRAIIVPHMFGMPADLDDLLALDVPIIEDCAHSIGATFKKKKTGNFGKLAVFSFYGTKMFSCGEGGMVCSNSLKFIDKIKDMREYDQKDTFSIRFNYKMTDIQAAMGLSQLSKLDFFIRKRRELAFRFNSWFLHHHNIELPFCDENKEPVFYRYVIKIRQNLGKVINDSEKQGICCRRPVYKPIHRYLKLKGFYNTELAWKTALSIPLFPSLTESQLGRIKRFIKESHPLCH